MRHISRPQLICIINLCVMQSTGVMAGWKFFASAGYHFYEVGMCTVCVKTRFPLLLILLGFYGRPWTMEQRKELFRRYCLLTISNTVSYT